MNEAHELEMRRDPRIARALRASSSRALPGDFAQRMAAQAAEADAAPFENVLMTILVIALGISVVAIALRFGDRWRVLAPAIGWLLAFAGCVGASWVLNAVLSAPRAAPARP